MLTIILFEGVTLTIVAAITVAKTANAIDHGAGIEWLVKGMEVGIGLQRGNGPQIGIGLVTG